MNENELKVIAKDKSKSETQRMISLIRLANIWGKTIDDYQLDFIYGGVYNLNKDFNLFEISQLSRSYANRLQLIEAIVIDREKHCLYINWFNKYVLVLYICFYPHSSRFNNDNYNTEFDRSIRDRICQLIIEKMRFVLSNNDVISIKTKNNGDSHMKNLYYFTRLIDAYRIKIDTADLQLLQQRFDQARTDYPNHDNIPEIVSNRLTSINENSKQK